MSYANRTQKYCGYLKTPKPWESVIVTFQKYTILYISISVIQCPLSYKPILVFLLYTDLYVVIYTLFDFFGLVKYGAGGQLRPLFIRPLTDNVFYIITY